MEGSLYNVTKNKTLGTISETKIIMKHPALPLGKFLSLSFLTSRLNHFLMWNYRFFKLPYKTATTLVHQEIAYTINLILKAYIFYTTCHFYNAFYKFNQYILTFYIL